MKILKGKSAYQDICQGPLCFREAGAINVGKRTVEDRESECRRFAEVRHLARLKLQELHTQAVEQVGVANAEVFEVHRMLLEDPEFVQGVEALIQTQGINLEYAIKLHADKLEQTFLAMEEEVWQERAGDVQDVAGLLLRELQTENATEQDDSILAPYILVADDLLPSETVQLSKEKVFGLILRRGSLQSHTAIFARSMGIPAVVGVGEELTADYAGMTAVIDGFEGVVYIEPDEHTEEKMRAKKAHLENRKEELLDLIGQENETMDGKRIKLLANAGTLEDVERAVACDAGGVGLLRSEILYLGREEAPDEELQFAFYKEVLEKMQGKEVIVRTLDVGADKELPYLMLVKEENPALGLRGIRIGLKQPELLKTQLRALYRAGVYGKLAVMYPMITSLTEVRRLHVIREEVKQELEKEGIPYAKEISTGIMIETPAAVMLSEELAKEVDFFSVGTNDLAQYTTALDRQNDSLAEFDDMKYTAVFKMIEMACNNAHKAGIPIGVCGELAADSTFTERFLRMGIDELSVAPERILPLRKCIRNLNMS